MFMAHPHRWALAFLGLGSAVSGRIGAATIGTASNTAVLPVIAAIAKVQATSGSCPDFLLRLEVFGRCLRHDANFVLTGRQVFLLLDQPQSRFSVGLM
jgi:hypothetical protein